MSQLPPPAAALDETPINRDWMRVVGWVVLLRSGLLLLILTVYLLEGVGFASVLYLDSIQASFFSGIVTGVQNLTQIPPVFGVFFTALAIALCLSRGGAPRIVWVIAIALIVGSCIDAFEMADFLTSGFDPIGLQGASSAALNSMRQAAEAYMLIHFLRRASTQPSWMRIAGLYLLIQGLITSADAARPIVLSLFLDQQQAIPFAGNDLIVIRGTAELFAGLMILCRPKSHKAMFVVVFVAGMAIFGRDLHEVLIGSAVRGSWMFCQSLPPPLTALLFLILSIRKGQYWSPLAPRCRGCGYLLVGLPPESHKCPECGAARVLTPAINR